MHRLADVCTLENKYTCMYVYFYIYIYELRYFGWLTLPLSGKMDKWARKYSEEVCYVSLRF